MEDDHYMNANFDPHTSLFCIFDGHGGKEVATFCANHIEEVLKQNESYKVHNFKRALQ